MTRIPPQAAARKAHFADRLFVGACTVVYIGLMTSVVLALHLGR